LFKKELCEKQDILNKKKEEINKIFDKANVKSIKGYEKKYTLFIKYKKLKENSKNLEQKLNVVLEGKDYDDLVDTVKDYYSNSILPEYNELKYRKLEDNIFNIQNKLMKIKEDISRLDTEINEGMNNLDNPVSIEERLNMAKIKKEQNVIKLRALKIADNFIKDASRKIHREFAPQLNKTVAKTINKITSGKYNNIRISPDMKIKVIHRNGEIHELSELSKGTIDQFYFATRIALASLLTGTDDLPLLFDDSFVQFDRERLKNTIKYLYHLSADRQIILFTCHQRELDIINELGFEVNLIKL